MIAAARPSRGALLFACAGAALFVLSLLYFLYSYLVRFGTPSAGTMFPGVLVNVLLFSLFALHHSLLARARIKARVQRIIGTTLERSVYTWVASALFLLVCWGWQPVPGALYTLGGLAALPGYALQGLGIVLTVLGSARLDPLDLAGLRPVLLQRSGGDPRPMSLETGGIYRLVRHPVYFGWVLFVFGAPQMTMTRLVFACVSTAYLAIAIPFEERSLVHAFGSRYREYQDRVRWKMLPGLY